MNPNDDASEKQPRSLFSFYPLSQWAGGAEQREPLTLQARPQLATHCYFLANARKADVLWTRDDFRAVCQRMLNGNSEHYFMLSFFDEKKGKASFPKARLARASKNIDWTFDTIRGRAKRKTGIGFYPDNDDDESCWAALDFDAHNQEERLGRAYIYAGKAFDLLCREAPSLCIIAGTSGQTGGWHIFLFAPFFYPTRDWTRLLREVADRIGAPIQSGICEIFPDDNRGQKKGIRAPGTWNPKDDSFGLIAHDGLTPEIKRGAIDKGRASLSLTKPYGLRPPPLVNWDIPKLYRGEEGEWKKAFAITSPRLRNDKLASLVGTAFWQVSKQVARDNARLQYEEATPAPGSSVDEHFEEFERLWASKERDWLAMLSPREREKFSTLTIDNDRESFRIIRNWSNAPRDTHDFKIVAEHLAARIAVSIVTASKVRIRLCAAGILRKTADFVPHQFAARYEWIADKN